MTATAYMAPDLVLVDIVDYVFDYKIQEPDTFDVARLCMIDTLACAFDALDFQECVNLLGPVVPGAVLQNGARVPGTDYNLDPATAAFNLGCMLRWLDMNDAFSGVQGIHPSDALAGILMLADYLSRQASSSAGRTFLITDVLEALVKAYEIQGCIAMQNDFSDASVGIDQSLLARVASAAVLTHMLGATHEQVLNAVSNAWIDSSLLVYRRFPNTGSRKSWATADAILQAMRLALMAVKGEMGYPSVLTAKGYGFYDARFRGKPFTFERPYGEYVIKNSMFKCNAGGMLTQSAAECAFQLHPLVKDRLDDVARIDLFTNRALITNMDKTGPLHNAADRDHCAQYVIAVALINGKIHPQDYSDDFAMDPRIDKLRELISVTEDPRYTKDFYDPGKRSSANALQVHFKNGASTQRIGVDYPAGHPIRRSEVLPVLVEKFETSIKRRFSPQLCEQILTLCNDTTVFDKTEVNQFVDLLAM